MTVYIWSAVCRRRGKQDVHPRPPLLYAYSH